jgi:hypothetical protein
MSGQSFGWRPGSMTRPKKSNNAVTQSPNTGITIA